MKTLTIIEAECALDAPHSRISAARALTIWLQGFGSENTRRAYRREMERFASHCGSADMFDAAERFLGLDDGPAHAIVDAYRGDLIADGLAPATINRSMAALNSFTKSARRHDLTTLRLEARSIKSKPYRDTKGPGLRGVQRLLDAARVQRQMKADRDVAIIRLLFSLGLRRGEVATLNMGHVDLETGTVSIKGKGRTEREPLTLCPGSLTALAAWMKHRPAENSDAALFVGLDHANQSNRLSGWGIYHVVRTLGRQAGVKARPHGLRHTAITAALDTFNGDVRKVRSFSRHANVATLMAYDDNRNDGAGQVSQAVDALVV